MPVNITPTPAEATLVNQIFLYADPQKLGVITGDAAIKVFDGAKLLPTVLGEIWQIADEDNQGWLSRKGVAVAVRLMGWAQKGERVTEALLQKPGPIPKIEGVNTVAQQSTGMSLNSSKSSLPVFPPLTAQEREKYLNIFMQSGPANGLLSGDRARNIFLKSKLSTEHLIQIWNLSDTQDRGSLDSSDFAIAMYFIQGMMSKRFTFIPTSLPPGLYQQAAGAKVASHMTGNSGSFSPPPGSTFSIQQQHTGQRIQPNHTGMSAMSSQVRSPALPPRPAVQSMASRTFSPPVQPPALIAWDVTPAEQANSDQWFEDLDTDKKGFIEGGVAVPFMLQSGLPGDVLAAVWDLADLNNDGLLTREGFAVAMHLIQKRLTGVELPATLPPSLVPPSMRQAQQVQQQVPEPQKDLFSFDESPPPSANPLQSTGGFPTLQPQRTGLLSTTPTPTTAPHQTGSRSMSTDPFAPPIAPSHTGSALNFLDDDEPITTSVSPPPLQDRSAEIGNLTNQLNSTNKSVEQTRAERQAVEQLLSQQASQLSSLQTQLASAKASYETELKLFSTLQERHSIQQAEIDKVRQELISAESDLSARKLEKSDIEGAFMRDKEDHRELQRKTIETDQQIEAIKVEIEKLKKEGKHQKGMLAIAKKQLASREAERAKVEKELQEAHAELQEAFQETVETEEATSKIEMPVPTAAAHATSAASLAFAAAQPLPISPDPNASPAISTKSNNPFERLALAGGSSSRTQSPFAPFPSATLSKSPTTSAEDDLFGLSQQSGNFSDAISGLPYDTSESGHGDPDLTNGLSVSHEAQIPVSPNETEFFHTPPTSARMMSPDPTIDSITSKFPAIESVSSQSPPVQVPPPAKPTNGQSDDFDSTFATGIEEINQDDSDSDSDSDDEVPLAVLSQSVSKQNVAKGKEVEVQPANELDTFDDIFASPVSPTQPEMGKAADTKPAEPVSALAANEFDDIFKPSPTVVPVASPQSQPAPEQDTVNFDDGFPSVGSQPTVVGVDAFDEAFKKPGSASSAPAAPFSFAAAFDDDFDFNAAKSEFPLVEIQPTQPALQNGTAQPGPSFEDIFTAPVNGHTAESTQSTQSEVIPAQSPVQVPPHADASSSAFDAVFTPTAAVPLVAPAEEQPTVVEPSILATKPAPAQPSVSTSSTTFPTSSPTVSPKQSISSQHARPSSPFTSTTSPPQARSKSPKPKPAKDNEKPTKEPTRHSKLSLRLPFGRKKKQDKHEAMPTSNLSAHSEVPERVLTPALGDDVEPVKQLTDMGFSRSQAVAALEKYGYDIPRALNSLLNA
ncbi:hypothetical protein FA15DRAFT_379088 [Coprinopsis marcescibilis]|uniref:EF-hand n=1 Tax=Coprinopsis marcescibilis TaxID=230819 RepID=A0A5C3KY30_COPMA|nr:hypothetical protein FA15DRAFT_379088 [Coprinopsis marcescibilis]